jgi:hypothetical protein
MKNMKYKIEYQNAVKNEHMGMTYGLEECIQIIARDCGFDDWDLDWSTTTVGMSVVVDCKREMRDIEIARLIEIEAHTNEEESREILEVLGMDIASTGDLSDALSDLTENMESTYRIIRSAIEVLCDVTDLDEPSMFHTSTQRAVFVARAMLQNIVK